MRLLLSLLLTSPDSVEGKIFKKKFMKKLVKASLIGKALGGKSTKIIVPLFIPMHMPKPSFHGGFDGHMMAFHDGWW